MQYQVDLHMHTTASSHAYSTIQENVIAAKAKGLKLIAITDHGAALPDAPHPWHFINMRIIPRIIEDVAVLRGIEANILNIDGEIDCDDMMYSSLDMVIAGFHDPVLNANPDIDFNTQAMIATIKNPKVNIISHPGNPKFPIDAKAVAKAAKQYNVALEINNSSFISRKGSEDNCHEIILAVKEAGGLIALGSDSHIAYSIGDFSRSLALIEEVNFPIEHIINRSPKVALDFFTLKTGKTIPELAYLA